MNEPSRDPGWARYISLVKSAGKRRFAPSQEDFHRICIFQDIHLYLTGDWDSDQFILSVGHRELIRIPVYEGAKHNIVGILPVNKFLASYASGKPERLRKLMLKPYVFDYRTEIPELLQRMRLNKLHMVFLVDENHRKVGLITMEDLLEELVGDIQDESDTGEGLQLM